MYFLKLYFEIVLDSQDIAKVTGESSCALYPAQHPPHDMLQDLVRYQSQEMTVVQYELSCRPH